MYQTQRPYRKYELKTAQVRAFEVADIKKLEREAGLHMGNVPVTIVPVEPGEPALAASIEWLEENQVVVGSFVVFDDTDDTVCVMSKEQFEATFQAMDVKLPGSKHRMGRRNFFANLGEVIGVELLYSDNSLTGARYTVRSYANGAWGGTHQFIKSIEEIEEDKCWSDDPPEQEVRDAMGAWVVQHPVSRHLKRLSYSGMLTGNGEILGLAEQHLANLLADGYMAELTDEATQATPA